MPERETGPYDAVARKWLALVERRQEHFLELCDTGRWRHYYTQTEFLEEMRKVLRVRDQWAMIAGLPLSNDVIDGEDFLPGEDLPPPPQRTRRLGPLPTTPWPD
jgi:hypothetical protein